MNAIPQPPVAASKPVAMEVFMAPACGAVEVAHNLCVLDNIDDLQQF